ncbi:MAG: redoxin domain-containing protein, partial [Actinomycetota bacterium]|nr:redoxin domain-containing protein [Actinomycetota bacterium]
MLFLLLTYMFSYSSYERLAMKYGYPHFKREMLLKGLYFGGGPLPGRSMPEFDLPTTDGAQVRKRGFAGRRPLLLTFASITCPMVASNGQALKRLHEEFGDQVSFVTLYVREAHPGERYPQPGAFKQKLEY